MSHNASASTPSIAHTPPEPRPGATLRRVGALLALACVAPSAGVAQAAPTELAKGLRAGTTARQMVLPNRHMMSHTAPRPLRAPVVVAARPTLLA